MLTKTEQQKHMKAKETPLHVTAKYIFQFDIKIMFRKPQPNHG